MFDRGKGGHALTSVCLSEEALCEVERCCAEITTTGRTDDFLRVVQALYLRGYDYDPAFLACVLGGGGLYSRTPPDCLSDLFRQNTTLLPDDWEEVLSVRQICDVVRRKTKTQPMKSARPTEEELDLLIGAPEDDEIAKNLFPPRTKEDLTIRKTRIGDVIEYAHLTGCVDEMRRILRLCRGYDYALTCNLLVAGLAMDELWWTILEESGCFDGDGEHYRATAKILSDTVKKRKNELSDHDRVSLYECAALYGALCPPVPGWDPVRETRDLATGGQVAHGLLSGDWLRSDHILDMIAGLAQFPEAKPHDVRGFDEWLQSCEWERSGSSSIGRVRYEIDDRLGKRTGHFKARKNLVMDVVPFEEVRDRVRSHATQDNRALIKSEFGKIRLAVAAPLETYLQQAYLYAVSGCAYLRWPGNTLEESIDEEMCRNERTVVCMREEQYALPYDFARFDHQPTTSEVVAFQRVTFDRAFLNAAHHQYDDVRSFEDLLERGFAAATLTTPPGVCEPQTFRVTGGLMSGLRSTSSVGSGWNAVLGECAREMVSRFRSFSRPVETWQQVRGDDTQVVSPFYLDVLGVKIGYDALGAEANESKFTLRRGRTEFLRVETGRFSMCYPCRTVPLINQRKPWNVRPPTGDGSVSTIVKVGHVLSRRLKNARRVLGFITFLSYKMARMMGIDPRLVSIPVALGGLGLLPWAGKWCVRNWHPDPPIPVRILNKTTFRADQESRQFAELGVRISRHEAEVLADRRVKDKVAADDLVDVAGVVAYTRRNELRRREIVTCDARLAPLSSNLPHFSTMLLSASASDVEVGAYRKLTCTARAAQASVAPMYSSARSEVEKVTNLSRLAAVRQKSLGKMLRHYMPEFYRRLTRLEASLKLRRSSAIDFLLGNFAVPGADGLPPCVPRLAGIAGAVFLSEQASLQKPATHIEALRWYEQGARMYANCLLKSAYGEALLHV